MINIIILEDEPAAANRLKRLLHEIRPEYNVLCTIDNVEDGMVTLKKQSPDLILSDIELADGTSFEIFKKVPVNCPIIFITAFNHYAVKAFELNSIHYLLKPIKLEQLLAALLKFEKQQLKNGSFGIPDFTSKEPTAEVGFQLISKIGNTTKLIELDEVALIYSKSKVNRVINFENEKFWVNYSLDELMLKLPHQQFFKINRNIIVNKKVVVSYKTHSSNRLILKTKLSINFDLIVSKGNAPAFKKWLM